MSAEHAGPYASTTPGARADDEGVIQIPASALHADPPRLSAMLGLWTRDVPALSQRFRLADPFPHIVIDGFFAPDLAEQMLRDFPPPEAPLWHVYANPLEKKRACSTTAHLPPSIRDSIFALCAPTVVEIMRQLAGMDVDVGLQADRFCHGGGIHCHTTGGKLDVHLDYSLHPLSGLERRLNLIIFLNPNWVESFGGELQLFESIPAKSAGARAQNKWQPGECRARVLPAQGVAADA